MSTHTWRVHTSGPSDGNGVGLKVDAAFSSQKRRQVAMTRRLRVASVLLVLMAVLVLPAQAGLRFCAADPIFRVGGELVDVLVEIRAPAGLVAQITQREPVKVFLTSPKGTDPQVVWVGGVFTEEAYASEHKKKNENSVDIVVKVPKRLANHPVTAL